MDEREATPNVETMRFGPLTISSDPRVLRPREWTLTQSEWAADLLVDAPEGDVLELCTGAGQIGLAALTLAEDGRRLVAVDADPVAVGFARANAHTAGLADRVEVRQGELGEALEEWESFALVVADPPWVQADEVDTFPEDPTFAIDGGEDGLAVARECVRVVEAHLAPGGSAILQLGDADQADTLRSELDEASPLRFGEVRRFERGALVRIDRPAR
ncbi:methyltransferase [Mobilicoccus pelagius]|uniref:Protein methyltransferase HemK n=1 Tax=Mobilicoccus pelagius NBRC 104925 TaxID=1089455 RepID=H5USG4_9MICO|nr:methyltransferase [Mobilicoccus pelagius]GAB48672.1 protein methyltransferase HemK [Mobilicoccus pelagius NBRC 104925]